MERNGRGATNKNTEKVETGKRLKMNRYRSRKARN